MTKKKSTAAEIIEDVVSKLNEKSQPDASKSPIDDDPCGTLQAQSERNLNLTAEATTEDVEVTNDVTLSNVGTKDSNIVLADSKNDPNPKSKSTSNSNHNDNQSTSSRVSAGSRTDSSSVSSDHRRDRGRRKDRKDKDKVDQSAIMDIAVEVVIAMDLETMIGDATGITIGTKVETVIVITVNAMILATTPMIIGTNVITKMSLATHRATHTSLIQHSYRQIFRQYHHLQ